MVEAALWTEVSARADERTGLVGGRGGAEVPSGLAVPGLRGVAEQDAVLALIAAYDWPYEEAVRIFTCESGLRPDAISPDGQNVGVAQINLIHGYSTEYLLDAERNLAVAYALYLDQGWAPWACW